MQNLFCENEFYLHGNNKIISTAMASPRFEIETYWTLGQLGSHLTLQRSNYESIERFVITVTAICITWPGLFSLVVFCSLYPHKNHAQELFCTGFIPDFLVWKIVDLGMTFAVCSKLNLSLHLTPERMHSRLVLEKSKRNQEPIKWSLHLPYKPLESTLSRVDL